MKRLKESNTYELFKNEEEVKNRILNEKVNTEAIVFSFTWG